MVRLVPLVLIFAACTVDDSPHLQLVVGSDGTLHVTLARGVDHVFSAMSATANGIDLGAASVVAGSHGTLSGQAAGPATASYAIAMAQLGSDVHVEVDEGDEHYVLDAANLGARRDLIAWSLGGPMTAGTWLLFSDGARDRLGGGFAIVQGTETCTVEWASSTTVLGDGTSGLDLQISSDLARDWWCSPAPAPGATVAAQLEMDLMPVAIATACTGVDLKCEPIELPALHAVADVTVQF